MYRCFRSIACLLGSRLPDYQPICTGTTLAAFCADSAEIMREKVPSEDSRFPEGVRDLEVTPVSKISGSHG